MSQMRQYEVVGRHKPTEADPNPKILRMKLFSPNSVMARSRFWYYMSLLKKVKRQNGEIISVSEIFEKNPNHVKNYGMWLRYDSRSGTHNMYREYRDTTLNGAVDKMYSEMAARHRSRRSVIQIIRTTILDSTQCKRPAVTEYHNSKIKLKLKHRINRPSAKKYAKTFKAQAPCTFF